MIKVSGYKCSFCQDGRARFYLTRSGCKKHEARCWMNPARKSCATCINLSERPDDEGDKIWSCHLRKYITPFKSKVVNCWHWATAGTIFGNEAQLNNRPIERNENPER